MTTVISVRGRDRAALLADPNFRYVGRQVGRGRNFRWSASDWGNPFKAGMTVGLVTGMVAGWHSTGLIDRDIYLGDLLHTTTIDLFREWILACPVLRSRLHELRDKTLGCWCGDWKPGDPEIACHAVVLAKLADSGPISTVATPPRRPAGVAGEGGNDG